MGNLPTARTETCVSGALVSPNLINEIQDVLVAINTGLTVQTLHFAATPGIPGNNLLNWDEDAGGVRGTPLVQWTRTLQLPIGRTAIAVRIRVKDVGGTTAIAGVAKSIDTAVTALGGGSVISDGSGNWQTLTRAISELVVAGTNYYVNVGNNVGAGTVHFAWVQVDIT
jgi:hypothetical protein